MCNVCMAVVLLHRVDGSFVGRVLSVVYHTCLVQQCTRLKDTCSRVSWKGDNCWDLTGGKSTAAISVVG